MTSQEQELIDGLIGRVRSTQLQSKDAEAEQHLQQGLAGVPDALYVLVQTVLVQQYGLEQAQAQISALQRQIQALQQQAQHPAEPSPASGGSFLSHLFGGAASTPAPTAPQSNYQPVSYPAGPPQSYSGTVPPPPPYGQPSYPQQGGAFSAGGGFLHNALQTAAGVAAGEMMFRGMEDLFSGFGGHQRGFAGQGGETVVNDFSDDDRSSNRDDNNFYNPSDDASRQDSNDNLNSANFGGFNADNSSPDDSSSFGDNSADFGDTGSDDFSSDDTV